MVSLSWNRVIPKPPTVTIKPHAVRYQFVMFAQAGLSLDEIAQVTGVTVETAKSRLRYARAKLRQSLAGERSAHV